MSRLSTSVNAILPTNGPSSQTQPRQLLGYISFKKKTGLLVMSNFQAKLEREHLDFGESTKRSDKTLAGFHGEGFKVAALVMLRNNYGMKFESNSFYWNFGLRGRLGHELLYCSLIPKAPETLLRAKERYEKSKNTPRSNRQLSSNIWEDTTVKIGLVNRRNAIHPDTFRQWLTTTLDLQKFGEHEILHVQTGDLILAKVCKGAIYLKGLKVGRSRSGPTGY
ncbi:hypothetical protein RBB50_011530 [Rhinocladiella similis]